MAIIERHWEKLTEEQWKYLAEQYLLEIRTNSGKEFEDGPHRWGEIVTNLGFWSPPELLWKFTLLTISLAKTNEELGDIAAGCIAYLLGRAGDDFIDNIEQEAKSSPKFAKTLTGCCYQYLMSDEVWQRLQNIQSETKIKLSMD